MTQLVPGLTPDQDREANCWGVMCRSEIGTTRI